MDFAIAQQHAYNVKTGFWRLDRECFFNKHKAVRAAVKSPYNLRYHFFDEVYESLDWSKEPTETIEQLYKERAQQIRDEYSYVALAYSGGSDSECVLHSFLSNNIHLDEVITSFPIAAADKHRHAFNPSNTSPINSMFEYYEAALPKLQKIATNYPLTKITVVDNTEYTLDEIRKGRAHLHDRNGMHMAMSQIQNTQMYELLKGNQTKNRCIIVGVEKPVVVFDVQEKMFKVCVSMDVSTSRAVDVGDLWNTSEWPETVPFFSSPQCGKMVIKQCKLLKPLLKQIISQHYKFPSSKSSVIKRIQGDLIIFDMQHPLLIPIIYPNWDPKIFQAQKTDSWFLARAEWAVNELGVRDYFMGAFREHFAGIPAHFFEFDEKGDPTKFKAIGSRLFSF